jgi:AAA+ superfamily predicted ATPase
MDVAEEFDLHEELPPEIDPKQELADDVARARAEHDRLEAQLATDRETLETIRTAIDKVVETVWRDVYSQQQTMRSKENITAALTLSFFGGYQWPAVIVAFLIAVGAIFALQAQGAIVAIGLYLILAAVGFFVARDQCLTPVRKARMNYLANDGKDVRFVAFTKYEPGLNHPLIGYDGPVGGAINDRAWKIPGVREKEALQETFVEVIDDRLSNVLLTRFPDRKPTLVHADLENPFVRAYGVFFQRALERHLSTVEKNADDFYEIVQHYGQRKVVDEQLRRLEVELHDFDGTAAIMKQLLVSSEVRNKLLRQVVLFRLGDKAIQRGTFLVTGGRTDPTEVLQALSRASAATLLQLSFSQIKVGYVGQGAATVTRVFDNARRTRSIVFIDEAEAFFGPSSSEQYEPMRRECVKAILQEWESLEDRSDVWIVAAARSREGLDEGIVARFGSVIDFTPDDQDFGRTTTVIDGEQAASSIGEDIAPEDVVLPDPVVARNRLLSAMFAHVDTMESQGITVPRAVLIAGPSKAARSAVIRSLEEQTSLPVFGALIDHVDDAMRTAREYGRALVSVDVPEFADPGSVAHLAVLIDQLVAERAPIFILAATTREGAIDPELRSRFGEFMDLTELDAPTRRAKLESLLAGRPVQFDLRGSLDDLEARTAGMTEEQLNAFVDEATRKAALRAIDSGEPDRVEITLDDFDRRLRPEPVATKDDEAAL